MRRFLFAVRVVASVWVLVLVWARVSWPEFVLLFYVFVGHEALGYDLQRLRAKQDAFIAFIQTLTTEMVTQLTNVVKKRAA